MLIDLRDAATRIGVSQRTVGRLIAQGYLEGVRIPGSRHRRTTTEAVERYIRRWPAGAPRVSPTPSSATEREWLTTGDVASAVGVALKTVGRWIETGLLPAQIVPGGAERSIRRIRRADLADFLARHGLHGAITSGLPLVLQVRGEPPRAEARKRWDPRSGRVYPAAATERWRSRVLLEARQHRPPSPLTGPLRVDVDFLLSPLASRREHAGRRWSERRVDRDNLDKPVLDSLTEAGWWADDAQVRDGRIRVIDHAAHELPGICVYVWRLTEPPC